MKRWATLFGVLALAAAIAFLLLGFHLPDPERRFHRIREGMTEAEVGSILGPAGPNSDSYRLLRKRRVRTWLYPKDTFSGPTVIGIDVWFDDSGHVIDKNLWRE